MRHVVRLFEVDEVVILDLAPLPRRGKDSFVCRNRIVDENLGKLIWLTVPVIRKACPITREALIDPTNHRWQHKHLCTIMHCYPMHDRVSPSFLSALADAMKNNDGTLFNLNWTTLDLLVRMLAGRSLYNTARLQSDIVSVHTSQHRLEIARKLNASHYIAGAVEWELMQGQLELFRQNGIEVVRSPTRVNSTAVPEVRANVSSIHEICRNGLSAAQVTFARLLEEVGVSATRTMHV